MTAISKIKANRTRLIIGLVVLAALIVFPFVTPQPQFWVVSVGIRSMWLGIVAMSLIWLAKYTGMLSLGQLAFWGVAGYSLAIMSTSNEVPYIVSLPLSILIGTVAGFLVALICVRTQGVYFLMLTLAVAQLGHFFAMQASEFTGGHVGIGNIVRPELFGMSLADRNVLYFVGLALAVGTFLLCRYVSRTPFGLAMAGIRDSPERMRALGYNVYWYRVAAFTFAAFIASIAGALALFYNVRITPFGLDLLRSVDVLIVSVLGGINSIIGAFVGGLGMSLLVNFSQEAWVPVPRMTLTGLVFVGVLLFMPGGLVGLFDDLRARFTRKEETELGPGSASSEGIGTTSTTD